MALSFHFSSGLKRVENFPAEEPLKLQYGLIAGLAAAGITGNCLIDMDEVV